MQKAEKKRQNKMTREQQLKHKQNMELPVNKFMNAQDDKGKVKYSVAAKLREYVINNPDPILIDMRMSNALLHSIRFHKRQSLKYKLAYESKEEIGMYDKNGRVLERDDCYLAHISEGQNVHIALSKLREHLSNRLLSKCDGEFFTFDQYNQFVTETEKIIAELGYELFPTEVKLIHPL